YLTTAQEGNPRVFSHFMSALIEGSQMKLVNGGHNKRCYTYIDDAVDCIERIIANPEGVCDREIFNIGSPQNELSIRELAERMRDLYALKFRKPGQRLPDLVDVDSRDFYGEGYEDSDRRIPDITKARTLLGWEPKFGLDETIERSMVGVGGGASLALPPRRRGGGGGATPRPGPSRLRVPRQHRAPAPRGVLRPHPRRDTRPLAPIRRRERR